MAYANPDDARAYRQRWLQTDAGRESRGRTLGRYHASPLYRDTLGAYRASPQGQAASRRAKLNYRATLGGWYRTVRDRALGHGIDFTLSQEEVEALVAPMICAVTGMPLEWRPEEPRYLLSPSLDRLDGARGYVPGNVQCVALWANFARGSSDLEEFKQVLAQFKGATDGAQ